MKVYSEISMSEFRPWSGAVSTYDRIQNAGLLDELEALIEEMYPDGCSETAINDLLWFEDEWIFNTLGLRTESEIREEISEVREELSSLMEDFEAESEELETDEEKVELFNTEYHADIQELQRRLEELEDELSEI